MSETQGMLDRLVKQRRAELVQDAERFRLARRVAGTKERWWTWPARWTGRAAARLRTAPTAHGQVSRQLRRAR